MGLDKLKKKKKPHQLVKKRKDGKRPGYYGSDAGFGDYDDSPSSSGGGGGSSDNGGGYDYEYAAYNPPSPAPSPAPEPEYDTADFAITTPSPTPEPDTLGDDLEDDVTQMMVDMGLTPDNAPTISTLPDPEDDGDTGDSLYVSPTQTMKDEEPYYGYTPGPNYVTADELSNLNRGLGDSDEQAATLAKIQAVNPIQKAGFFDSGIGSVIKTAGKLAAPILAPALLPAVVAKPYTAYNQLRTFANIPSKFGLTDRTLPTLTELAKNIPQGTGNRVPNIATGYESDGDNRPIPKDVITASVQKFSPEQMNKAITFRNQLQSYAETGKLNEKGQVTLQQLNNLIEQYQVSI